MLCSERRNALEVSGTLTDEQLEDAYRDFVDIDPAAIKSEDGAENNKRALWLTSPAYQVTLLAQQKLELDILVEKKLEKATAKMAKDQKGHEEAAKGAEWLMRDTGSAGPPATDKKVRLATVCCSNTCSKSTCVKVSAAHGWWWLCTFKICQVVLCKVFCPTFRLPHMLSLHNIQ